MMRILTLIRLFYCLVPSESVAQTTPTEIILRGKILDKSTKEPLSFATISIKGKPIGVVSNFLGEFVFRLPETFANDTLQVSMLGYHDHLVSIKNSRIKKELILGLEENPVLLEEVVVNDKPLTAREIVENVIENIPINYPVSPYLLEGFSRASHNECGKYQSIYEATFELYGIGYHRANREQVFINESRRSKKVDYYHSRVLRNNRNLFIALSHVNDVKKKSGSLDLARNTYELERYTMIDDRLVYVITTIGQRRPFNRMYIGADDFALLKLEFDIKTLKGETPDPILNFGPSSDSTRFQVTSLAKTLQFEKMEEKYYPKYINWSAGGELFSNEESEAFCDWGWRFEMMFDKVIVDNVNKPPKERLMRPRGGKDPDVTPYNSSFWKEYKLIRDFPITEKIVEDLGGGADLERQFEQRYKTRKK